ncbi:MAG: hypothetical protein ABSC89_14470 [Verrucomicrobiota bacterium]|jgi:hypothetical protein
MKKDIKVFRAALFPPFVTFTAIGLTIYFVLIIFQDGFAHPSALLFGAIAGALAGFLITCLITKCFSSFMVKLTPDGVQGYSVWGFKRFIQWQDIGAVRPFRLLNLRYLRLYSSREGTTTWITLFLARRTEFEQELRRLAPPDNPILGCLS